MLTSIIVALLCNLLAPRVVSPDGKIAATLTLEASGGDPFVLHLQVQFAGRDVLGNSPLRIDLRDGTTLGTHSHIESAHAAIITSQYVQHPGKRRAVAEHASELVVSLREGSGAKRRWQIVLRAYDDGVAWRYRFPEQDHGTGLEIARERTSFAVPADARAFALPLNSFTTSYEKRYQIRNIGEVPADWLLGLPLLLELPGTGWAAISEANLSDYAGMYLARDADGPGTLVSRLAPWPNEPGVAVRAKLPHESPWRVVLIADEPGRLIESDLLLHLNEPCSISDTSWIKPGKTTFPWWNGYYEEHLAFECGLNTATAKHYIDFCAEAGIPYHSLDGKGNTAWYGGPIVPYEGADITRAIDGLDLPEVLRHAQARGVRIRLWMHWRAAQAHMERAFPLYRAWGVEGVMVDFMDRDDQEMVRFMRRLLQTAADNRLTVTLHGVCKPTGLERTYPHLLSSEGVLNLEYDKWDKLGVSPGHELTVAFTRMLAGPLDFHQGCLRTVAAADFKPRNEAPFVIGTPCRTLASYVVYQNHLPMVADYPSAYRGHPALPVLSAIPCTWDDTRVLAGTVGEFIVIARRSGPDWWIGAMTGGAPRRMRVPLAFLSDGDWDATLYEDAPAAPNRMSSRKLRARIEDTLEAELSAAGGLLVRLTRR